MLKLRNNISKLTKIAMIITIIMSTIFITKPEVQAANAYISCPDSAEVGKAFTITVLGSAAQWELSIVVNGSIVESKNQLENGEGNQAINFSASYTPQVAGTLTIALKGSITQEYTGETTTSFATKTITVKPSTQQPTTGNTGETNGSETPGTNKPQLPVDGGSNNGSNTSTSKSSNNYLSSLSIDKGTLTPKFSREKQEYTLEFPEDFDYSSLDTLNVSAKTEDTRAKVTGTGAINVVTGENIIEVKVTAENSSVRTYRISFVKPEEIEQSDLRLSSLIIKAIDGDGKSEEVELDPEFNTEIFNYELNVAPEIESLEVEGKVENEKISIKVEGAEKLNTGKNLVRIILTSPTDEEVKSIYQITVNRDEIMLISNDNIEVENKDKTKLIIDIVAIIIVILVVILITLLIINYKKNKKMQLGEEKDKFEKNPEEESEEKKQKLFDYDEEDTYLTEENLKKWSDEFKETAQQIEKEEKEKHQEFDKMAGEMESEKYTDKVEIEPNDENANNVKDKKETEEEEIARLDMEKEAREQKLAELEKEIKDKRKKSVKKVTKEKEVDTGTTKKKNTKDIKS